MSWWKLVRFTNANFDNNFTDAGWFIDARGNADLSVINGKLECVANTASTFGVSYELTNLVIGNEFYCRDLRGIQIMVVLM